MAEENQKDNYSIIDFSGRNINENSEDLMNLFLNCPEIIELDLSNNMLTKLPLEISFLTCLTKLDIRNNAFSNFEETVKVLTMIKNLTELDIDLIDSNEAMLVLNNLPNVLKLNGRNTKDDDDEEEEENGEREGYSDSLKNNEMDNHNIIHNDDININNVYNNEMNNRNDYLHPQMEEIEEDKNLENNSNYVSSSNNNDNNILNNFNSYGAANEKEKTNGSKKMTRNIKILNENEFNPRVEEENNVESNTDGIFQPNSLLYDKIIANNSNKKNMNLNMEQNIDIDANNKKIEKENESIFDMNNINSNNTEKSENFLIDISNEELILLKVEKYNKNTEFISFMKDFCEMINNEDYENSDGNRIQNNYLSKIKSVNDKKGQIPNYYYIFLLQKKKIKI